MYLNAFSLFFKFYNLSIREIKFYEIFCTCSFSNLGQDLKVGDAKRKKIIILYFHFGIEMEKLKFFDEI